MMRSMTLVPVSSNTLWIDEASARGNSGGNGVGSESGRSGGGPNPAANLVTTSSVRME